MWPISPIKEKFAKAKANKFFEEVVAGNSAAVERIINKNPEMLTRLGGDALLVAAEHGHTDMVSFLVKKNVPLEARDKLGRTALILALILPDAYTTHVLLDAGASVSAYYSGFHDVSVLGLAVMNHDLVMVKKLVGLGADVNDKNIPFDAQKHETPLYAACRTRASGDILEYLLGQGADINAHVKSYAGHTPLMAAVNDYPQNTTVGFLLKHHADINAVDEGGWTALMHAINAGNKHAVDALFDHGALTGLEDDDGRTDYNLGLSEEGSTRLTEVLNRRKQQRQEAAHKAFHDGVDMTGQWLKPARIVKQKPGVV